MVRAERNALLRYFAQIAQAENLKATAICENSAVPVHKTMQPACFFDGFVAWSQKKMIGIAEDDAGAHRFKLFRR